MEAAAQVVSQSSAGGSLSYPPLQVSRKSYHRYAPVWELVLSSTASLSLPNCSF